MVASPLQNLSTILTDGQALREETQSSEVSASYTTHGHRLDSSLINSPHSDPTDGDSPGIQIALVDLGGNQ